MTNLLRNTAFILALALTHMANGQERGMFLHGRTMELNLLDSSEVKVGQIALKIFRNDSLFLEVESSSSGKYNCFLPFGQQYAVHYGSAPYVVKIVDLDLRNVAGKTQRKGFSLDLDMAIFQSKDEILTMLHEESVARASYDRKSDLFIFDPSYSAQHKEEVSKAILAIREKTK